jgi:hypothetical protein
MFEAEISEETALAPARTNADGNRQTGHDLEL